MVSQNFVQGWLYLLHFSEPYYHARHYLGWVHGRRGGVAWRLARHLRGDGSPLVAAAVRAGLRVELALIWPGTRGDERALKRRSRLAAHCPLCQAELLFSGQKKRRI